MIAPINHYQNGAGAFYTQEQLQTIFERKSLLARLEDSPLGVREFAKTCGVSAATIWRYKQRAEQGVDSLLDRRTKRIIRGSKVSNEVMEFIFSHLAAHPKTTNKNVYRVLKEKAEAEHWRIPSYGHICRLIAKTPYDVRTVFSENARVNWEKWGLVARRESEYPNACWQMDATELDVWTLDTETGALIKPWMTSVIDTYTRVVIGILVHRKEPTSEDSLRVLLQAIMPKNREDQPFFGIPVALQSDNHAIYKSDNFLDTVLRLGIGIKEIPNHCPSSNGKIERFFRTFQMQFLTQLNGYANQHGALAQAKKHAIPFPLLQGLAEKYLLKYHTQPHAGIQGMSPWEKWHSSLSDAHGLIFNTHDIREKFMLRKEMTLQRDGFELEPGRHFSDPALTGYVGEKLTLRLPLDERPEKVEAYFKGEKVGTLRCVEEYPSLADKINEAQLHRTIELQKFRKQMRDMSPTEKLPEEDSITKDSLAHIQSVSSSKPKKDDEQLNIPDLPTEE